VEFNVKHKKKGRGDALPLFTYSEDSPNTTFKSIIDQYRSGFLYGFRFY